MAGDSLHFSVGVWALSAVQAQTGSTSGLAGLNPVYRGLPMRRGRETSRYPQKSRDGLNCR